MTATHLTRWTAAAVGAALVLAFPAAAAAWNVHIFGSTLDISTAPGEVNAMTVEETGQVTVVHDANVPYTGPAEPANGLCRRTGPATIECARYVSQLYVDLGDEDDSLVIHGRAQDIFPSIIVPGPGEDTVRAGFGSEVIRARDGERDTLACDPPDRGGFDTVIADAEDVVAENCEIVLRPSLGVRTATVTTTADEHGACDSSCSLREATRVIQDAGAGTVVVPAGTYEVSRPLWLYRDVAVRGAGAGATVVRGRGPGDVVAVVIPPGEYSTRPRVEISDLTLRGDCSSCSALSADTGELTVERASVEGGGSGRQVGISAGSARRVVVRDSSITGHPGGGLFAGGLFGGPLSVVNSTISANGTAGGAPSVQTSSGRFLHATLDGPGTVLSAPHGAASLRATIVAGPCEGDVRPETENVLHESCRPTAGDIVADPQLGPLGDHGGATATRVPAATSPALDLVTPCILDADQRGFPRPLGTACDSGAVEAGARVPATAPAVARDTVRPSIRSLAPSLRRGTRAALRRLTLSLTLSEPARVRIALRRNARSRVLRRMTADLPAGRHRLAVGRRLLRGALRPRRYVITLTAEDASANRSTARNVSIRLQR